VVATNRIAGGRGAALEVRETWHETFEEFESTVRSYCRVFPAKFERGKGSFVYGGNGGAWLDFLSAAGALNYGHNHPVLKQALLSYIEADGVVCTLDMYTEAKQAFLMGLNEILLRPRGLDYKCQFCGPTGTNAVEAALKLASKVTGRHGVVAFSNSYHGMSRGSLSVSSSFRRRNETYLSPSWVTFMPFDGFTGEPNEVAFIDAMLKKNGSGVAPPAAFIVELVQGEGGVNVASTAWVAEIAALARELGSLLIVDDIQAGCGRTGKFFSFEHHGVAPDLVCLSKSVSAYGLPMSLLLIRPELDVWAPGEHNGTFRGFTYAHVTALAALREFWAAPEFEAGLGVSSAQVADALADIRDACPRGVRSISQLGLFAGIRLSTAERAERAQRLCFERGLLVETCGPESSTVKLLPALTIDRRDLQRGLDIIAGVLGELEHEL
jgi:diaminobutyrate-2-oxoglutarate transaminase